jgi:hypothetical protein
VVADAQLVATELVTNAASNGEPPIALRVIRIGESGRLEVEDVGRMLQMVVRERSDAITGRGLAGRRHSRRLGVQPGQPGGDGRNSVARDRRHQRGMMSISYTTTARGK